MFRSVWERGAACASGGAGRRQAKRVLKVGLILSVVTMLAGCGTAANDSAAQTRPTVNTSGGPVRGFVTGDLAEFFGIPYAAPPVRDLRWRPPIAHAAWTAPLDATAFGPTCAQNFKGVAFAGPVNNNEDCLYLNIFTPKPGTKAAPKNGEKLPVMFWIHGGGNTVGESNDYDGSKLALQGRTVVVTINFRLGLLGFLAHPALDNEGHQFANYGTLDQQFALKWVKDNIANFGGDPDNVTIFGESGGANSATANLLSPLAHGLFHRVIIESGGVTQLTPLGVAEAKGVAVSVAAGCGAQSTPAVAACLRDLSAAQITALGGNGILYDKSDPSQGVTGVNLAYLNTQGVIGDGQILPLNTADAIAAGKFNHVPVIIGGTLNEGAFVTAFIEYYANNSSPITDAEVESTITGTFTGDAGPGGTLPAYPAGTEAAVSARYPRGRYQNAASQLTAMETDGPFAVSACSTRHLTNLFAGQVALYTYEFRDQTAPNYFPVLPDFTAGAFHTAELPYLFPLFRGYGGVIQNLSKNQEVLADEMVAAWTNFAWTGNPNGHGDMPWPRYTENNRLYLSQNLPPAGLTTMTDDEFSKEHQCDFWDKVLVYRSTAR